MYFIFCLIASGLVDFNFSSPNCMLTCIFTSKDVIENILYFCSVIRSVQYWNWAGFYLPFTCLPADGRNLSPHGAQTDGRMLVFSFQSSVLILLSSECISWTDYACQAICNMCHDSIFF